MAASRLTKLGRIALTAAATAALTAAPLADAYAQFHNDRGFRAVMPAAKQPTVRPGSGPTKPGGGPMRPSRPGHGGGNWGGVATGIGIGIAAGIILGAAAAHANQPPPGFYDQPPGRRPPPPRRQGPGPSQPSAAINVPPPGENRFVPDEVVLEFPGNISPQAMNALAARHRLQRIDSQAFTLTNSTYLRARITDGRPVRTVLRGLGREAQMRAGQPNYRYTLQQGAPSEPAFTPPAPETPAATPAMAPAGARPAAGDPAQYALAKLRLGEAHGLARGDDVLVAVIDSGIETTHPELAHAIAGRFDALDTLGSDAHPHGTAMAGAIVAQSKLLGIAPGARILAIRAFGASDSKADGTSFAIMRGIEHAAKEGARVINMSFAGPADPGIARQLTAARGKGIVLVAAAGNAGPKSAPLYPAADPNVIAVTATDAEDRLFKASNRGRHVAVAAPGVDVLVPAPDANYQVTSGTSVAAAHVSGVAALILQRKPGLSPDGVRNILMRSARDLGPRGRDDQFGAGLADAYQAVLSLEPQAAAR